jgi:membrane protease YdiL (CAAX protease family)
VEISGSNGSRKGQDRKLHPAQLIILLILLIGYPLLSIVLDIAGATAPAEIESKTTQIYLPTLALQVVIIASLWMVMRRTGSDLSELGLGFSDFNRSNILAGIIFFVGAWLVMVILRGIIAGSGTMTENDLIYILPVTGGEKTIWVFLAAGAALSEEIAFRGYVISRVRILTGSYWIGAVLGSAAFATGHLYQGSGGVLLIFIYGMLFSGLFIARKSVVPCIIAHFLQDVTVLAVPLFLSQIR